MKKLLVISLLGLCSLVKAQTTNLTYVLTIEESATRTNQFTNSIAQLGVVGVHVAYESYKAASTNNTQNFRQFAKDYFKTLSEQPLKDLGRAYQLQSAQINKITTSIQVNWENASAADRKLLTDWLAKYPVAP